jgi:hypothetical protein
MNNDRIYVTTACTNKTHGKGPTNHKASCDSHFHPPINIAAQVNVTYCWVRNDVPQIKNTSELLLSLTVPTIINPSQGWFEINSFPKGHKNPCWFQLTRFTTVMGTNQGKTSQPSKQCAFGIGCL